MKNLLWDRLKEKKIFSHEVGARSFVSGAGNILFEDMCMIVIRNEEGVLQVCNTYSRLLSKGHFY